MNRVLTPRSLRYWRRAEVAQRKKLPERYTPKIKFSDFVDNDYIPIHAKGSKYEANIKGICKKLKNYFSEKFYMRSILGWPKYTRKIE